MRGRGNRFPNLIWKHYNKFNVHCLQPGKYSSNIGIKWFGSRLIWRKNIKQTVSAGCHMGMGIRRVVGA